MATSRDCPFDQLPSGGADDEPSSEEESVMRRAVTASPSAAPITGASGGASAVARPPLAVAAAASRARHRRLLRETRKAALASGRRLDPDVAAACLDALDEHLGRDGSPLTRPAVNAVLTARLHNWATMRNTVLPDGWVNELWTVLTSLDAGRHLAPGSDPMPVLLEPLACYGRIGLDGEPLADGVDVTFACQCYLPYDPTLPNGMGQVIVGMSPDGADDWLATARLQPRACEVDAADWLPWLRLTVRADGNGPTICGNAPRFLGAAPAEGRQRALWFYAPTEAGGPGQLLLALDDEGWPFFPKANRRCRRGYRWVAAPSLTTALCVAGFG